MKKIAVLYISYSGMLEPLGRSQVLGYVELLSKQYEIHLISFEKIGNSDDKKRLEKLKVQIAKSGIDWIPLPYHRSPSALATSYDIIRGTIVALRLARKRRIRIVHCRSYVASVIGLAVKRLCGASFVFDMRGFWADERVDGGLWPSGSSLYKIAKFLEKRFFLAADAVVSLTEAGADEISSFDYLADRMPVIAVIPTCADLELFKPRTRGPSTPFTLGYVGSIGTWYLFEEFLSCFKSLRQIEPDARLLIVNRNQHDEIRLQLAGAGIDQSVVEIVSADHREVPDHIARMTAGTALIKPVYSKIASAPTKLAEFLGMGKPCLGNTGVGDVSEILKKDNVGVLIDAFHESARKQGMKALVELTNQGDITERCVAAARKRFSIDHGVSQYSKIYNRLSET